MKAESVMYTSLDFYWMPFAANRQFKKAPRLFRQADGMHLEKTDGRRALKAIAMSWWLNAGNCYTRIADLLSRLDGSSGHSAAAAQSLKNQSGAVLDCQEHEVLVRTSGDIVALSPPFVETAQAGRRVDTLGQDVRRRT